MKKYPSLTILVLLTLTGLFSISCAVTNTLLATPTPIPTNTPTITPTPLPTNTPTPTLTPTPVPSGIVTENLADGSTQLIDYDNEFQLALPKGWTAIPFSLENMAEILALFAEENPELAETAETFEMLDEDIVRAIALNEDPRFFEGGFATNLTIAAIEDNVLTSMSIDFIAGILEENFTQGGAKVLTEANIAQSKDGVEFGTLEIEQLVPTASSSASISSKYLVFLAGNKLILLQLATPNQFRDELFPIIDNIGETILLFQ